MDTDYTQQLNAIVSALNQQVPEWVIALLSALLGVVFGLAAQFVHTWWTMRRRLDDVRRILYVELATLFALIDDIEVASKDFVALGSSEDRHEFKRQHVLAYLTFDGEAYLKANADFYMKLSERASAATLYRHFHMIEEETDRQAQNMHTALVMFSIDVVRQVFSHEYLVKYLGKPFATRIITRAKFYHEQNRAIYEEVLGSQWNEEQAE